MTNPIVAPTSYCQVAAGHPLHGPYHDEEYGFPTRSDDALLERLVIPRGPSVAVLSGGNIEWDGITALFRD